MKKVYSHPPSSISPPSMSLSLINGLRGTLKNIMFPAHRSFADPYDKIMVIRENPAKCPSLAKNPPKYTTAYIVQQSNCRWHCEPTCSYVGLLTQKSLFIPSLFNLSISYPPSLIPPSTNSPSCLLCQFDY